MSKMLTSADPPAAPSRCYIYWRAPSGFWTRRVAVEKIDRPWCAGIDGVRRRQTAAGAAPVSRPPHHAPAGNHSAA